MYSATNTRILVPEFDYLRPPGLDAALKELRQHGRNARVIAGGTDLLVRMKMERSAPTFLVDVTGIPELRTLGREGDAFCIGAAATIRSVARAKEVRQRYRALVEACDAFSTVPIMVMGTLGGNLCNASPAADTAPALLVFDAVVDLASEDGKRSVPLPEFFVGPGKTSLRDGEIMVRIRLPMASRRAGSSFLKIARVAADISKVSVAVRLVREGDGIADCRIAVGACAPTPIRLRRAEECLAGRRFERKSLEEAAEIIAADIRPISDVRASREYRKTVARVIARDALETAWARAGEGGVA